MGQIMRYRCNCGYCKELMIGGGLLSNREEAVRKSFVNNELGAFDKAKENGSLTRFFMNNTPAVCPACQELEALPVLHYWENAKGSVIQKVCPVCRGDMRLQDDSAVICPKCGKTMDVTQSGLWD